uniref:Transmembrane protein 138 n=1 Tax=Chrysemys picta bellii TaxID=8478 RepID=A0A8C3HX04_CHRPI
MLAGIRPGLPAPTYVRSPSIVAPPTGGDPICYPDPQAVYGTHIHMRYSNRGRGGLAGSELHFLFSPMDRPISPPHGWVKPHPWCGNLPQLLFLVSSSLPGVILSLQEGSLCSSLRLCAGLVNLLFHKFKGTIVLSAAYLVLSIAFHIWIMNLRWKNSTRFVWTDGLQALFVFQRLVAVLYCYFYKRTALHLGDPRFYQDSLWLRKEFAQVRS